MKIKDIKALEILDSRGNPTVAAIVILDNGAQGTARVPSGASTGSHEAAELRDGDKNRYNGLGVLTAVKNIREIILPVLVGLDPEKQAEIDELMAFVRLAQREGERFDLPAGAPIVIAGDMNLVGLPGQLATLVRGEIADTTRHGAAFAPDWDGTPLADLSPRHLASPHTFTWYSAESSFTPGRLDYLIFTDSVLEAVNGFVLHTPELPDEVLAGLGLKAEDTETASDHLPVVADLAFRPKSR